MSELRDKAVIERFLRRDAGVHLYELGDLDDVYWPHTRWHAALGPDDEPRAIVLLFTGSELPVVLAFEQADQPAAAALLEELAPRLPVPFYMHVSTELFPVIERHFAPDPTQPHVRMCLTRPDLLAKAPAPRRGAVERLATGDLERLQAFYTAAYPGNWFEPAMLKNGVYYAAVDGGRIVSVAGTHVVARSTRVAAIGNVATLPDRRGEGFATGAMAALCRELLRDVDLIGLNVASSKQSARRCYERLGFTDTSDFLEVMVRGGGQAP